MGNVQFQIGRIFEAANIILTSQIYLAALLAEIVFHQHCLQKAAVKHSGSLHCRGADGKAGVFSCMLWECQPPMVLQCRGGRAWWKDWWNGHQEQGQGGCGRRWIWGQWSTLGPIFSGSILPTVSLWMSTAKELVQVQTDPLRGGALWRGKEI